MHKLWHYLVFIKICFIILNLKAQFSRLVGTKLYCAILLNKKENKMSIQTIDLPSGEAVIEKLNRDYLKVLQELETTEKTDRVVGVYFHLEIKGQNQSGSCLTRFNSFASKTTAINVDANGILAKKLSASIPSQLVVNIITTGKQNCSFDRHNWTYNVTGSN
jgi:hypothetical protein